MLNNASGNAHEQDSLEVFIDENNHKSGSYEQDDKQYRISYTNDQSFNGTKCIAENVTSVAKVTADGYVIEAKFKWTDITPVAGMEIGLEFQINDADATGSRIGTLSWYDETGMGWSSPGVYGTVKLVGEEEEEQEPSESPAPGESPAPQPGGNTGGSSSPSDTDETTETPESNETKAPIRRPFTSTDSEEEEFDGPVMPDEIQNTVSRLSKLLEGNASERQKLNAVNQILTAVRELAEKDDLDDFSKDAMEYTEDLISKALNKHLVIEYVGDKVPVVSKVIGALLSVSADKDVTLVVENVEETAAPDVGEEYTNGVALDITLLEDGVAIQPLVPITIRMRLPELIDRNLPVKVLHYADGSAEPEVLDVEIIGDEMEFTTTSFSTFVVVNDADNSETADDTDAAAPAEEPVEDSEITTPGGQQTEAEEDDKSAENGNKTFVIVIVVIVVILAIVVGIIMAIKTKKDDKLE